MLPPLAYSPTPAAPTGSLRVLTLLALSALAAVPPARAQISAAPASRVSALRQFSLEDLMSIQITSASRKEEPFAQAAAALAVVTDEDLHQTGALTLADALRYVPGLAVARIDEASWGVSARGFNLVAANKLQVQMDGRSLYTPLFGGVFWGVQDTLLEDIERIEVIRGPGATAWGANAVNGVISITTKNARDTQGALLSGGVGTEEQTFLSARYGGALGDSFHYRVYGKTFQRDALVLVNGADTGGDWHMAQGGFRIDGRFAANSPELTLQGDYYDGSLGFSDRPDGPVSGGNLLMRAVQRTAAGGEWQTQLYFDHATRKVPLQFGEVRHTWDLDTQYRFASSGRHDVIAGLNYRTSKDHTAEGGTITFAPPERRVDRASAFVQDEIMLLEDRLGLIVGSKLEYHESVGVAVQPSIRAAWRRTHYTLWGAVSRAVRVPSRFDEDLRFGLPTFPLINGSRDFVEEKLLAYELGYRVQVRPDWSFDAAAFYNDYCDLRSQDRTSAGPFPRTLGNELRGDTYGVELSAKVQVLPRWRLEGNYSYLHKRLTLDSESTDPTGGLQEGNDPQHMVSLVSSFNILDGWEINAMLRHVSALPSPAQPGYDSADLRIAWRPDAHWELELVGQNLLQPQHPEFGADTATSRALERSAYARITCRF